MVWNLKPSNVTTITTVVFGALDIIYLAALTPWEYPSVPTVDVFRTGCKNLLYQVKSSTET